MVMQPSHLQKQVLDTCRCLIHAKLMTANEAKLHKKTLTCLEHQRNDEADAQDQFLLLFSDSQHCCSLGPFFSLSGNQ